MILLVAVPAASVVLVADAATSPFNWQDRLVDLGVLGMLTVAWLTEKVVTGAQYRREQRRADRLEQLVETKVLPAIAQSNEVLREAMDLLRGFRRGG